MRIPKAGDVVICSNCNKNKVVIPKGGFRVDCKECIAKSRGKCELGRSSYEWVPDSVKQSRKDNAKDITQPYLPDGSFNGKFKEYYPERSREMVKDGQVSQKQYSNAKSYKGF